LVLFELLQLLLKLGFVSRSLIAFVEPFVLQGELSSS
jgi:hypothetical protein